MQRGPVAGDLLGIVVDCVDQRLREAEPALEEVSAELAQLDELGLDRLSPRFLSALALALLVPGPRGRPVLCLGHGAIETWRKPESNYQSLGPGGAFGSPSVVGVEKVRFPVPPHPGHGRNRILCPGRGASIRVSLRFPKQSSQSLTWSLIPLSIESRQGASRWIEAEPADLNNAPPWRQQGRGSLIGRMGQDQHDIDELARMEQLCRDLAEQSRVPGDSDALREIAENYGRQVAKMTVGKTVDCSRRRRKMRAISAALTGHPFRQSREKG